MNLHFIYVGESRTSQRGTSMRLIYVNKTMPTCNQRAPTWLIFDRGDRKADIKENPRREGNHATRGNERASRSRVT